MGILINSNDVRKLSERINRIPRDIVIIGGDFFDGDLASVLSEGVELDKTRITAPLGVFAVTGNHDYFGNIDKAVEYIAARGIRVLMDECVTVGGLRIAGREDVHGVQVTGKERMSLRRILGEKGGKYPLIVVDHTPGSIAESVDAGALLHLSGHTHAGQMWPIGMITSRIYPLDWGYRIIGKTHCYVSSGYGSWGPPIRIGNTPEIVKISILPL
jgi:predicted MPP superfamily phosphohydrolase